MKYSLVFLGWCLVILVSCNREFEPIDYGRDACAHCKMTIVDERYAAELITVKGRSYKFDDVLCMKQFMNAQHPENGYLVFVEDYLKKYEKPLDASKAVYLKHETFSSPMNGNYAAFANRKDAEELVTKLNAATLVWENVQ